MSLAENLATVRARVAAAARAAGRDPDAVTLVAVSKTRPPEDVREARAAGQVDFGENYAQELRDKADALGPGFTWHYIGSLQSNKVKYVVGRAAMVHDVDRLSLAEEISKRSLPRRTAVLLGVNIGEEPQKSGVLPGDALALARQVVALPGVELRGLMCIPPAEGDATPWFRKLAALAARGRDEGLPLHELSMGMSHDFEAAIAEGATIVRVGTAIFGARAPKA
ncbi:MAG: YggS family pyridoxal phosphate-dependent enzyme [Myxococcota bacterium]